MLSSYCPRTVVNLCSFCQEVFVDVHYSRFMTEMEGQEIVFTLAKPQNPQEHFIQTHFVNLMERGATEVNGELVANMEDLRLCLRQAILQQQGFPQK